MIMIIKVASIQQSSFKTCRCFDYSVVVFFSEGTGSEEPKAIVKVNYEHSSAEHTAEHSCSMGYHHADTSRGVE